MKEFAKAHELQMTSARFFAKETKIVANNFCQPLNFHDSSESAISFFSINVSASNVNGYFDKLGIVARFIFC